MLLLLFASFGATETPVEPEVVPVIAQAVSVGGAVDDWSAVRYDLADDQDMQDFVLIFEAFRSVQHG